MKSKLIERIVFCFAIALALGMICAKAAYAEPQTGQVSGNVEFTFGDGKIGRASLTQGTLTVECDRDGNATPIQSNPFTVSGKAGNPISPYYTLSGTGEIFPGSLKLEISPAPPGGVRIVSVSKFQISRTEQTSRGTVVVHTYSFHADFKASHPNHGKGPGSLDASVMVTCPLPVKPTPTPTPNETPVPTPTPGESPTPTPTLVITPTPTPTIGTPEVY